MFAKRFIVFGKMLTLLLFISSSVSAKSFSVNEFQNKGKETLNKVDHSFHKNMLQPQVIHVTITSEPSVKPINFGFVALLFDEKALLAVKSSGQTNELLQDANRCESVSKLLFPFHNFW